MQSVSSQRFRGKTQLTRRLDCLHLKVFLTRSVWNSYVQGKTQKAEHSYFAPKIASLRKRRRLFVKKKLKTSLEKQIAAIPQKSAHRSEKVVSVQWSNLDEKVRIPQSTSETQWFLRRFN